MGGAQPEQLLGHEEGRVVLTRRRPRGFTIIELMVTVAVLALLMLLGAPSFATWLQNSQIRTAAEGVLAGVQLARAEAVRRNMPVRFQLTDDLTAACALSNTGRNWVVSLFDVAGKCDQAPSADTNSAGAGDPRIVRVRAAGEGSPNAGVTAVDTGANARACINFNGLGRQIPCAAGANTLGLNIDVTNPNGGSCVADGGPMRCLRVVVSPAGQVRMCDPQFGAADPMGC
jgi:type IV fimbrial biogenesis protein FimT